ncbi:unnamed protein product [Sphagnum balticum]
MNQVATIGRPTGYSDELADEICARLAEGRSMNSVCSDEDMPNKSIVYRWLMKYEHFRDKYTATLPYRTTAFAEMMLEQAFHERETEQVTIKENEKGIFRDTKMLDNVSRSQLMVNTLQWTLARMAPDKYGDKSEIKQKIDITGHYNEDDMAILDRLAQQRATDLATKKSRKPNPQEE